MKTPQRNLLVELIQDLDSKNFVKLQGNDTAADCADFILECVNRFKTLGIKSAIEVAFMKMYMADMLILPIISLGELVYDAFNHLFLHGGIPGKPVQIIFTKKISKVSALRKRMTAGVITNEERVWLNDYFDSDIYDNFRYVVRR